MAAEREKRKAHTTNPPPEGDPPPQNWPPDDLTGEEEDGLAQPTGPEGEAVPSTAPLDLLGSAYVSGRQRSTFTNLHQVTNAIWVTQLFEIFLQEITIEFLQGSKAVKNPNMERVQIDQFANYHTREQDLKSLTSFAIKFRRLRALCLQRF